MLARGLLRCGGGGRCVSTLCWWLGWAELHAARPSEQGATSLSAPPSSISTKAIGRNRHSVSGRTFGRNGLSWSALHRAEELLPEGTCSVARSIVWPLPGRWSRSPIPKPSQLPAASSHQAGLAKRPPGPRRPARHSSASMIQAVTRRQASPTLTTQPARISTPGQSFRLLNCRQQTSALPLE